MSSSSHSFSPYDLKTMTAALSTAQSVDELAACVLDQVGQCIPQVQGGRFLLRRGELLELVAALGDMPTHDQAGDTLSIPLEIGAAVLGRLEFRSDTALDSDSIAFLEALAPYVALAVSRFELENALKETRESLKVQMETGTSLTLLSHQLRSPLAAIKGYASTLLREDVDWNSADTRDFLETIVRQVDNVTMVITDILDDSALKAGNLTLNKEPLLLRNLCEKVINELKLGAPEHRFAVAFDTGFPIVCADPARVEQIIRNLLDNAIKYSDHGLIVVRGKWNNDEVMVSVSDQGIGIQPEHLNRLFEKFYRITNTKRQVIGTGLGLPIAREIVEAHHGRIWATSEVGCGTTLYFTLPVAAEELEEDL